MSTSDKSNIINMDKKSLKKLSKSQLIKLLLKRESEPKVAMVDDTKPVPKPRYYEQRLPVQTPRKSVKQMVKDCEEKQKHYETKPPAPILHKNVRQMVKDYEYKHKYYETRPPVPTPKKIAKPIPAPRTKIEQKEKALEGYTKSFEINIKNNKDPLYQTQNTMKAMEFHLNNLLSSMKGFKFVETLRVTFTKLSSDEIVIKTAYFNSKAQTIINHIEIHEALQTSKQTILNKIAQWISEGSGWTIQSIVFY